MWPELIRPLDLILKRGAKWARSAEPNMSIPEYDKYGRKMTVDLPLNPTVKNKYLG